jgi:Rieske Fe-S protein
VEPHGPEHKPHAPAPSLWPVGFAVGVAILLTGLVVGWWIVLLGAILAVAFAFLWVRDIGVEARGDVEEIEPETRARGIGPGAPALPVATAAEIERFPRSKFLEASTLGIGGLIGGIVTVPALGFAVLPAFQSAGDPEADVGPLDAFPENEWRIVTFLELPEQGEVSRRTAFVRYNGMLEGQPSFTTISNNCAHLGCPVQPSGPVQDDQAVVDDTSQPPVTRIPAQPAGGFACPCHGGAYDTEGNRTAGPPVRALDRFEYSIRNGRLVLGQRYSVGEVRGQGKDAIILKYGKMPPGVHVDGPEQILYPIEAPQ